MKQSKNRSKLNHLVGRHGETETLAERAGWMPGLRKKRSGSRISDSTGALGRMGVLELLEPRALLSGDHPGFPMPFNPTAPSTEITVDGLGNASVNGTIAAGDTGDFFKLTITTPDFIRVLANTAGLGSTLNTRVQVYNSTGTLVAQGNDNGEITSTSPLTATDGWAGFVPLAAGDYFILVTGQFGTTGNYELRVGTQTTQVGGIDALTGETTMTGTITQLQGEVVFYVDILPNQVVGADFNSVVTVVTTVDLAPPISMRLDTRLEIFDVNGNRVPNASDSDSGYLTGAFTAWRVSEGERYYIRVRSDQLTGGRAVGDFGLNFDFAAQQLATPVNQVTRRGEDQTQVLETAVDTIMFRFRAEGTGLTFITLIDLGPPTIPPERGFAIRLYDFQGNLIAFDVDFIGGIGDDENDPQIELPLRGGQEYFLIVDSFEPPPTPSNPLFAQPFGIFIEAHHTFDTLQPVDDNIDRPTGGTPGQIRSQFDLATPLTFGEAFLPSDIVLRNTTNGLFFDDRIPMLDHSYQITANASGRIHDHADSDLYKFVAPVDMLGGYGGNNDNAGNALYVGGAFNVADPNSLDFIPARGVENVPSRGLSIFDASSWWYAGPQVAAASGDILGFIDNPATAGTAGPEIYAMAVWDPDGPTNPFFGPMLVVAGDFILNIDDSFPADGVVGGVIPSTNIAVWGSITPTAAPQLNFPAATGYGWINPLFYGLIMGDANAPVRALQVFDEDGNGPNAPLLFAGGDFTEIGESDFFQTPAVPAARLAKIGAATGNVWQQVGTGITTANGSVRALTVYDPPDPGSGMPPGIPDPPDMPQQLVVGGTFVTAGGVAVNNIAFWGSASATLPLPAPAFSRLGAAGPTNGVTGNNNMNAPGGSATGVYALTVWNPTEAAGQMPTIDDVLVVGGNFTTAGGNAGTNNIALYGVPAQTPQDTTNPRLLWLKDITQVATNMPGTNPGVNSTVFALAAWDPADLTGQPPTPTRVLAGGAFTMSGGTPMNFLTQYFGTAANLALGVYDAPVRAITVNAADTQEQGIWHFTNAPDEREVVYIGGDFTSITVGFTVIPAAHVVQLDSAGTQGGQAAGNGYKLMRQGTDGNVFALLAFDDTNATFDNSAQLWDRNDRPAGRISVLLTPTVESFLNGRVTIYDGNFNQIFTNNIRNPPAGGTDPDGSFDQSLAPTLPNIGPALWAGATYYIEVTSTNNDPANPSPAGRLRGRYDLSVTIDALPPDINDDGVPDDTLSQLFETPGAGNWTTAQRLTVDDNIPGDTRNYFDTIVRFDPAGVFAPRWFSPGNQNDGYSIGSGGRQRRVYGQGAPFDVQVTTPSGFFISQQSDFAAIETIEDTDLYFFRANASGFMDVRINTTNITDEFGEQIWDYSTGTGNATATYNSQSQAISSPLHSKVTIFNNDLQIVGSNSYNPGVAGDSASTAFGVLGDRIFYHRDGRVVFPVIAGQIYFIQVESGQLEAFLNNPNDVDFGIATGSYELLVNGIADFNPDGSDDHANGWNTLTGANTATPVPIDIVRGSPTNGRGSINGTIRDIFNNPNEPNNDQDLFEYYAVGTGTVRLTGGARNNSSVALSVTVFDSTGATIASGAALPGGSTNITWFAQQGERFYIQADGAGGSQGDYVLTFVGTPDIDDHVNFPDVVHGSQLTINRFLGSITGSGIIENAGDTDVFQFDSDQYVPDVQNQATIRVTSSSPTSLDVRVRVYEIQIDPNGNEYRALIGLNDDERNPANPGGPPLSQDAVARFSITPNRTYYIVVEGEDPNQDFGSYNLTVMVNPTDDHPDFVAFPLATVVNLTTDPNIGAIGNATGVIELPDDDDVFRFTASAGGTASVALTLPVPSSFDPVVRVYNMQQVLLVTGTANVDGDVMVTFPVSRNQTYYIVVNVNTGGAPEGTAYGFQIIAPPIDDHANQDEFDIATQIFISSNNGIGTRTGVILPTTDTDLFRVSSRVAGALSITVTTPDSNLNPRIMVFNSARVLISGSSDDTDTATQIVTAGGPNQIFYILVLSDTAGGGDQSGAYTVTTSQAIGGPGPGPGPGEDDHPNAGDYTATNDIPLDTRTGDGIATGVINFAGDTDLFSFTTALLQAGVTGQRPVYLQITTPSGGLVDGIVRVYDDSPAHNLIATNSNGIPGATANLTFQATPGTRYFVLVEPVASNLGSYVVRLDTEPNTHYAYYPEGYSSATIDEFVPIVNPNNFAVTYTLIAHYETGVRDQVLVSNAVIAPHSRGGHTISTHGAPGQSLVRPDTPYSLEIRSNGQLAATFSHYDFGITTGENFTNVTSTTWSFSEVHKDGLNFRDFALFFNPGDTTANLTITLVYDNGQVVSFNRSLASLRRGGLNFNNDSAITTEGRFAVRITSDVPIVAALSSYRITGARGGFGLLGNAVGGDTEGVIPLVTTSSAVNSSISIYNASTTTTASVTITATYLNSGLPDLVRVISVNAQSRRTLTLADLGLVSNLTAGLRYEASVPVTLTYTEYQNGDGDSTAAGTNAATTALFGDAFVNPQSAGVTYIENLGIYNPSGFDTDVEIRFLFNDGTVSAPVMRRVAAGRYDVVRIDQQDAILNRAGLAFFSIRVDAVSPVITYFTHYDLFLNGGWSTLGTPVGLTNPLSTIG